MLKTPLFALLLVGASLCGCAGDAPKSTDEENIQGVWLAQTESQNGHKKNVTYQYDFQGDKVTFRDETGKEMKYSFKLEAISGLKLLTIQPEETSTNATPVSVAYDLNGDSLTLVIAAPGSRPTDLSDKNDQELIICQRKSP